MTTTTVPSPKETKLIFEGYFCQSRRREESFEYSHYLCKYLPVKYRLDSDIWGSRDMRKEILVLPDGINWHATVDWDDIIGQLVSGRQYRVTIEDVGTVKEW